jgi:hypothetical protein
MISGTEPPRADVLKATPQAAKSRKLIAYIEEPATGFKSDACGVPGIALVRPGC